MEISVINQIIKQVFYLSLFCSIVAIFFYSFVDGMGIFAGALWGCMNLFFIKHLVQHTLSSNSKDPFKIYTLLAIKFPLLYLIGYILLKIDCLPNLNLLLGFSLVFLVIFWKGLEHLYLKNA